MINQAEQADLSKIKTSREKYFFPSLPLRFPPEIIANLIKSTMLEPDQEKLVLLVGSRQGIVTGAIPVGYSAEGRNLASTNFIEQVRKACEDAKSRGLKIIADYHVHSQKTVKSYLRNGFQPQDAAVLSAGDIDKNYFKMQLSLQGESWSRAVGIVHDGQVFMNAFNVLRPTEFKSYMDVFEMPGSTVLPKKRGIVKKMRTYISDPKYLIEHLYLRPREIAVDGNINLPVVFNAMNKLIQ